MHARHANPIVAVVPEAQATGVLGVKPLELLEQCLHGSLSAVGADGRSLAIYLYLAFKTYADGLSETPTAFAWVLGDGSVLKRLSSTSFEVPATGEVLRESGDARLVPIAKRGGFLPLRRQHLERRTWIKA